MKALVFGSLNIDYMYAVDHIVMSGETLDSKSRVALPGGKGLNQAVALSKAGLDTYMAGIVGPEGGPLISMLRDNGVDTKHVITLEETTGHAIIQVDSDGNNSIVLFGGTNRSVTQAFIDEVLDDFGEGDLILLQNEINMLAEIIKGAKKRGITVALNPSPMNDVIRGCGLEDADILILNEVEGAQITGETAEDPERILDVLGHSFTGTDVVLTLGGEGSMFLDHATGKRSVQEAVQAKAIDTTGAGDTYTGYFLAGWLAGKDIKTVMQQASLAAGIAVGRKGAAVSIPSLEEVEKAAAENKV